MPRYAVGAFLLISSFCAGAQPVRASIHSSFDWSTGLDVSCTLEVGGLELGCRLPGNPDAPALSIAAGGLMVGPLDLNGLLWQLSHPLALASDAPAFAQDVGLRLGSDLSAHAGFACVPDETIGFFAVPVSAAGWEYGCFARPVASKWLLMECSLWLSQPDPEKPGAGWLLSHAPYPGGALAGSAVNVRIGGPDRGMSFTWCCSGGELLPGGAFCHLRAAVHDPRFDAGILLGIANGTYTLPDGSDLREQGVASAHVALSVAPCDLDARYSFALEQPRCFTGPFQATREKLGIALERQKRLGTGEALVFSLSGAKVIARHVDGSAQETSTADFAVSRTGNRLSGKAGITCSASNGPGLRGSLRYALLPLWEFSSNGAASWPRLNGALVSFTVQARRSSARSFLSVTGGFEKLPVSCPDAEIIRHFTLAVSWGTSALATTEEEGFGSAP